ncbi:MAG: S9 family peptidase [Actinobacteria bacterium]|nr:S9 family peptidase [Actinomycetota bacterium]
MASMQYPDAKRLDIVDVIHGHEVADPYRWLEDPTGEDTKQWSAQQDALVQPYLAALPGRHRLAERLRDLIPGVIGPPSVRGARSFFLRRQPDEEHAAVWLRDGDGTERALVDPNALSADATITLDDWAPSIEGDRLAYLLSTGGDEESTLRVIDVASGDLVDGPIDRTRYTPIGWMPGGEEFFYVRRLPPNAVPAGEDQFHRRVYRHRVGADPAADELVFGDGDDKTAYYAASVSHDGRWLIVGRWLGTAPRSDVYIADLTFPELTFTTILEAEDADTSSPVVHPLDGRLYVMTNRDAPRWRLVVTDPEHPQPENWRDVIPESGAVLTGYAITADAIVGVHTRHVVSEVTLVDKVSGATRGRVDLPGLGSADIATRAEGGDDVWIGYTDFVTPYRVLHYGVASQRLETWADPPGAVEVKGVVAEQVTYQSKDGTDVRLFVLHNDTTTPNGRRPTILYGYGGFGVDMAPAYRSAALAWVEAGGVYAVANIRGGNEEGEQWHRDGMRGNKQNVFDDFIAAAESLVANGWTDPAHLGISGGSNGGLLMGAMVTQRPDLFASVLCSAPLLDMIRYEQFGLGQTWNDEYGAVEEPEEFEWLLGYSPYHRVEPGTAYPAVLFTVFESDTRVDPNHARKMCAALQSATTGDRPILIRREVDVGHAGRSISRYVDLYADELAFHAARLGLDIAST